MRRPKWDKRSELAVKYCCHGSVHRAKPEFKRGSGVQHKRLGSWRPKTCTTRFKRFVTLGGSTWSLKLLIFLTNHW